MGAADKLQGGRAATNHRKGGRITPSRLGNSQTDVGPGARMDYR